MIRLNVKGDQFVTRFLVYETNNSKYKLKNVDSPHENDSPCGDSQIKEFFNSILKINSYKEVLSKLTEQKEKSIPGFYIVFRLNDNQYLFTFTEYSNSYRISEIKPIFLYIAENDKMAEFLNSLLRLDKEPSDVDCYGTVIETGPMKNYAFLLSHEILDVIWTSTYLNSINEEVFTTFKKTSKNGKVREITAPHEEIKRALKNLNSILQKTYDKRNSNFQLAYKKGKSVKDNATIHKEKKYVYNIDLKDFYPSCKKELVKKYTDYLFSNCYNRKFIEEKFFETILKDDALFIGSPISGTLANVILSNPIAYMNNICKKYNIKFSDYADDISFSSDKPIAKGFVINILNLALSKYSLNEYFILNEKKCVGFSGCNRKVTGVAINEDNKITVPRQYYRNLRTEIDHLSKGDPAINVQTLRGKIAYATMLDESGKMYNYLNKYLSTIKQYNLCSDKKLQELKERSGM